MGLCFQRVRVHQPHGREAWWQTGLVAELEAERACTRNGETFKPAPNDLFLVRPYLLSLPNSTISWGQSIQTSKPVGDIFIQTTTNGYAQTKSKRTLA